MVCIVTHILREETFLRRMPVFRMLLATDVGVSGVRIIVSASGVTAIIRSLKQRFCTRELLVCCCSGLHIYERHC